MACVDGDEHVEAEYGDDDAEDGRVVAQRLELAEDGAEVDGVGRHVEVRAERGQVVAQTLGRVVCGGGADLAAIG